MIVYSFVIFLKKGKKTRIPLYISFFYFLFFQERKDKNTFLFSQILLIEKIEEKIKRA